MRRLLILSAVYTGHGHKSISDSLTERLAIYDDLEVLTIDGFDLMTRVNQVCAEKTYGPITRMPGKAWALNWSMGLKLQEPVRRAVASMIRHKFQQLVLDFKPDCILSVHPMFLGTVLDLLEEMNLKIPVIGHEADLIDIAPYWFDKRLALVMAPSQEAYDCTLRGGVDPKHLVKVGFPFRSRFLGLAEQGPQKMHDPMTITIMSGSEGSGTISIVARELLKGTNAHVNVICGRNKALRKKLRKALLKDFYGRVNVMGFVEHIEEIMCASDILILRASPNSVMEAVALNKPIILFGQLAGQELHNPDMMQAHGLAKYCTNAKQLPSVVKELTANNCAEIEKMRAAQRAYAPGDVAAETAKILNDFIKPLNHD